MVDLLPFTVFLGLAQKRLIGRLVIPSMFQFGSHKHVNTGDGECEYIACINSPLLQSLGGIALREELGI